VYTVDQGGEDRGMGTGMELQYVHDLLLVRRSAPCAVEGWVVTAVVGWKVSLLIGFMKKVCRAGWAFD